MKNLFTIYFIFFYKKTNHIDEHIDWKNIDASQYLPADQEELDHRNKLKALGVDVCFSEGLTYEEELQLWSRTDKKIIFKRSARNIYNKEFIEDN